MEPLQNYQTDIQTAILIIKNHKSTAQHWVNYFYDKSLIESAGQWQVVCNVLDRILEEIGD